MKSILAAAALVLLAGCATDNSSPQSSNSPASNVGSNATRDQIIAVAREYVTNERTDWNRALAMSPVVIDQGKNWQVSFEPGGSPVILIDKQTLKVSSAHE